MALALHLDAWCRWPAVRAQSGGPDGRASLHGTAHDGAACGTGRAVWRLVCYRPRQPEATVLHRVVATHLSGFVARVGADLPRHVLRELAAYLDCGVFGAGAACYRCDGCGQRVWVALSCRRRGFCPSCCGRRMADIAEHLVERVLPDVPMRQWVLSVPMWLRIELLRRPSLSGWVLGVFLRVVFGHLRRWGKRLGAVGGRCGAVTVRQNFGEGLRLHPHYHVLIPDGVFVPAPSGSGMEFVPLERPSKEDLAEVVAQVRRRILRGLAWRGLLPGWEEDGEVDLLLGWQGASMQGRVAHGPRAGWRVIQVGQQQVVVPIKAGLCAEVEGFSLHAGVHIGAGQRRALESLCRYLLRPPLCQERLSLLGDGRVYIRFRKPYADGTRGVVLEPEDLLARLCAIIPPPRRHMVHYHGVFAPHAGSRSAVVPAEGGQEVRAAAGEKSKTDKPRRPSWAERLKRSFGVDVLACACGGRLKFLCVVWDPNALVAIRRSLEQQAEGGGDQTPGGQTEMALGP